MLLRTVALLRDQEVRSKKIIELDGKDFEQDWRRAASAMEGALKRITSTAPDGFGVIDRKWLPSKAILAVLSALTAQLQEGKFDHSAYHALQRWYWSSVFLGRYARSSDTTMYLDFKEMSKYFSHGQPEPAVFVMAQAQIIDNPNFSLRRFSSVSGAVYKGVMNLVALSGARDFANNDGITFHELDDHHIFPQAFLRNERDIKGGGAGPQDAGSRGPGG